MKLMAQNINNKLYVGSIIAATANPETGQNPSFGQLMKEIYLRTLK